MSAGNPGIDNTTENSLHFFKIFQSVSFSCFKLDVSLLDDTRSINIPIMINAERYETVNYV